MKRYHVLDSKQTGTRTVCGTDWPIETLLVRDARSGRTTWLVVHGVCNGIADGESVHKTRKAALRAYQDAT